MKANTFTLSVSIVIMTLVISPVHADWGDFFKSLIGETTSDQVPAGLTTSEIIAGLKEALSKGSRSAINQLGRKDGFFRNPDVYIPMPDSLESVESTLRTLKQDQIADEFVLTLNRAAEKAVPETLNILGDAIRDMSFSDAKGILEGPDDAATQYFRRSSGTRLEQKILPIVRQATDAVGVTAKYKEMVGELGFMASLVDTESFDIDNYVTGRTVDGLFIMLAREEKLIRDDPSARTTEILQKVFR